MRREVFVLQAYSIHKRKSIQYAEYVTHSGLARGVIRAMDRGADYVSIRCIRPEEGV